MTDARRARAVFFGSPAFAVPCLRATAAAAELVAVVSQPDRPAGRGQRATPPAVKTAAEAMGIRVLQPEKIKTPETTAALAALDAELWVVVAYGRILPQALLDLPPLGAYNVHASLLPRLRGAAPIQWAIIRGDDETGVSIMRMEAGLDTGPVGAVRRLAIAADDTTGTLSEKLAALGAALLGETLPQIAAGGALFVPQDDAAATLAPLLTKADGRLDFGRPARLVSAQARGVDPWPGATALLDGEPLRLYGPRLPTGNGHVGRPGEVLGLVPEGLAIACADGPIAFAELQLPGRRRLPAAAFLAGRPIAAGSRLGGP
jgi:methionyl-tRNA formyltransferase